MEKFAFFKFFVFAFVLFIVSGASFGVWKLSEDREMTKMDEQPVIEGVIQEPANGMTEETPSVELPSTQELATPAHDTSDWEIYRNDEYGFEVRYPEHWTLRERPEIPLIGLRSSSGAGIAILPKGGADRGYGSGWSKDDIRIAGRRTTKASKTLLGWYSDRCDRDT